MKIGQLAQATDTPVATIRHYERERLLPAPVRDEANYRIFGAVHVERLSFIRHCRSLDMTLDEIRRLLQLRDDPADDCAAIDALLDEHIGHVDARIRELKTLQRHLLALRAACAERGRVAECGILAELSQPAPAGTDASHVGGSHGPGRR